MKHKYDATDIYNQKKWLCFMQHLAKSHIDFMVLLHDQILSNGTRITTVPLLKKQITSQIGSDTDSFAYVCDMIQQHLCQAYSMMITDKTYSFITIAFCEEETIMKQDVPIWWKLEDLMPILLRMEQEQLHKEENETC